MAKRVKEPVLYELIVPVTTTYKRAGENAEREETIDNVKVRPPRVADLEIMGAYEANKMKGMIAMLSALLELPEAVIRKLDAEDFTALGEIVSRFLPEPPKT